MAQRRMISKSISVSKKLALLEPFPALLFTWLILHCDDGGNMPGDAFTIKGLVIPVRPETVKEVEAALMKVVDIGLIALFEEKGETYLHVVNWEKHQTLRKDRSTILYPDYPFGNQVATNGQPLTDEGKVRKGKVREGNNILPFDKFWELYPKKVGKQKTKDLWAKIELKDQQTIMSDIVARKHDAKWLGGFIKDPERYLKHRQWEDEITPERRKEEKKVQVDNFKK